MSKRPANTIPWRKVRRRDLKEWYPPARRWHEALFFGLLPVLMLCLLIWLVDLASNGAVADWVTRQFSLSLRGLFFEAMRYAMWTSVIVHVAFKGIAAWKAVGEESSDGLLATLWNWIKKIASKDTQPAEVAPAPPVLVKLREWRGAGGVIFSAWFIAAAFLAVHRWYLLLPFLASVEDLLLAATGLAAMLMWSLRRNRFDPRVWRFRVPEWAVLLGDEHMLPQTRDIRRRQISVSAVMGTDLVLVDDLSHFTYPLSPDLPEERRPVGVSIAGDTLFRIRKLQRSTRGRFYEQKGYRAVLNMLDMHRSGVVHGVGLLECKRLVAQVVSRARSEGWQGMDFARRVLAFVQKNVPYAHDVATTGYMEYARFPLETLQDGTGDCECKAILCCALLSWCGFDCALVMSKDHAWCGLLRPDAQLPWWHSWWFARFFTRTLAQHYWFGESTADDGGLWQTPTDEQMESLEGIVIIPAMPLTGGHGVEEIVF